MNIENQKEIYLDANFFVYWFIGKEPELKKRARLLFATFLVDKKELFSSPLAFDEAWWKIKDEYNIQNDVHLSCSDDLIFSEIKKFTNAILSKISLIQLVDIRTGVTEAMSHIITFGLRPRDAFHLAIMKHNKITTIITNDNDFIKKQRLMDISVQSMS